MINPWMRPEELSKLSVRWRERWGILANAYEDMGVPWPDHEQQAFDTIKAEKELDDSSAKEEIISVAPVDQSSGQSSYFSTNRKPVHSKSKP